MVLEDGETEVCIQPLKEHMDPRVAAYVEKSMERLGSLDDNAIIEAIYDAFPEYTIFSEIDRRKEYTRDETGFISIGYQGISVDRFIGLLIDQKVQTVVDLRRNPSSMRYSFSRKRLRENLSRFNIDYVHIPELGIASEERTNLTTLEDYQALFGRYEKELGEENPLVKEIVLMGQEGKIAMMCYENDPNFCHRSVVSDMIRRMGFEVVDV
jgi:uncharacterized protein (DUF488 family)